MDPTLSDSEKRFVLAEIIKCSNINTQTLLELIHGHSIEPEWYSIQVPNGRNLMQCFRTFQSVLPIPPLQPPMKRKSLSDLLEQPQKRMAMMPPIEPQMTSARTIQPRPPSNGYNQPIPGPVVTHARPPAPGTAKKRGRPSKADKEAQARASMTHARTTDYPPISPAPLAPLAPMTVLPTPRDFRSSPGYEISSGGPEQKSKKRGRPSIGERTASSSASFGTGSPSASNETPRGLPEPIEQVEKSALPGTPGISPGSGIPGISPGAQLEPAHPPPSGPSSVHTPMQQVQAQTQAPRPQTYEQYRTPDPIFPHRDRNQETHEQKKETQPPPLANRS